MNLSEIISLNPDFQASINIGFDFGEVKKIESLIPTDSVCRYVEEILQDVITASNQRSKLLVGPYGTGKSHITLAALSSMWIKSGTSYNKLIEGYQQKGLPFAEAFCSFSSSGAKLLPVIITGSSADLQHSLLYALKNALRSAGLESLMPQTNFTGALEVINRWQTKYPETLLKFEEAVGTSAETFISRLQTMETDAYKEFISIYPSLTSGGVFNTFANADVISLYDSVLESLPSKGINGIYVVYDEFSKYLEANIESASIEDTKLLQDFAERCNRSTQDKQLHLLLISHKSISNYIDSKLPKDKVDGWRGVSGRFREIEIRNSSSQAYELVSNAIKKDPILWGQWLAESECKHEATLNRLLVRYKKSGLIDATTEDLVIYGCFPLHPISAFLLPKLSEKVAQNERTLFTFLCSRDDLSLSALLAKSEGYVSPDAIFDYFEPLLKKEIYSSPIHKQYKLAKVSLQRVGENSLEAKFIKTICLIHIVAQYEKVAPTRQTLYEIFTDCGYCEADIKSSLEVLIKTESVIYLRQSNSYLKLKEASGIQIEDTILNRSELIKASLDECDIINEYCLAKAMYPSRYNYEYSTVRYFDCGFISSAKLKHADGASKLINGEGEGAIAAVMVSNSDELDDISLLAAKYTAQNNLSVIVVPKTFKDISDTLFRYAATLLLKNEAAEDVVLAEEYEIALEDYSEIIARYVDGYFRPENKAAIYFAEGEAKKQINRRRKLSDLISNLCAEAFPNTPRITSEALNKNKLTGTALHSRAKILNGLCAQYLEPNLGFMGNGQETSMMRSALGRTGIIEDFSKPSINLAPYDYKMKFTLEIISKFVSSANKSPFSELYTALTSTANGIGMKRGPIPLYIAVVLRNYKDELKITKGNEERQLSAELLDDISANPSEYSLSLLNWSSEKAGYISALSAIFCSGNATNRTQVADAMRRWFASLPQLTRNSKVDHTNLLHTQEKTKTHFEFLEAIRRADIDSDTLLFTKFPHIFGENIENKALVEKIQAEKAFCDSYINNSKRCLANKIIEIFSSGETYGASLDSVLKDWVENLPDAAKTRVFSGVNNQIITAIQNSTPDEETTVARIAKAALSLRIEDWNDVRFEDFLNLLTEAKKEAEAAGLESEESATSGCIAITCKDKFGNEFNRTFNSVEYSKRGKLLKNSIVSSIDEMGGSITPEEKRQIVFDVLRGLC